MAHSVELKDVILPAELKKAFSETVRARQEGQAALERARGESAALRNLANAARLLDDNPSLMNLRVLQSLAAAQNGNTLEDLHWTLLKVDSSHHRSTGDGSLSFQCRHRVARRLDVKEFGLCLRDQDRFLQTGRERDKLAGFNVGRLILVTHLEFPA